MADSLVSTRLDEKLLRELDRAAKRRGQSRSHLLRSLVHEGLKVAALAEALESYRRGMVSLGAGARAANISLREFMAAIQREGLSVPAGYGMTEAAQDVAQARGQA